jgi:hypothetical protein
MRLILFPTDNGDLFNMACVMGVRLFDETENGCFVWNGYEISAPLRRAEILYKQTLETYPADFYAAIATKAFRRHLECCCAEV